MAMSEGSPQDKFHDIRKKTDSLIQYSGMLKDDSREEYKKAGRELSIAYTKLQEAKMWFGKALEAVGSPFPEELRDKGE